MSRRVLSLNVGSSSVKAAVHAIESDVAEELARVTVECAGDDATASTLDRLLEMLGNSTVPSVVGHRVVHGGDRWEPALIDDALMNDLRILVPFAPLHLPPAIDMINAARNRFPDIPHVACFDTTFHWSMPKITQTLPLPATLRDVGIRRYGFHGLSYEHVVSTLGASVLGRAVIA